MFELKNVLVFITSTIMLCILIIILNRMGIKPLINMSIVALIYGCFAGYYFGRIKAFIALITIFYILILVMSLNIKVLLMWLITVSSYFIVKKITLNMKRTMLKPIAMERTPYNNEF